MLKDITGRLDCHAANALAVCNKRFLILEADQQRGPQTCRCFPVSPDHFGSSSQEQCKRHIALDKRGPVRNRVGLCLRLLQSMMFPGGLRVLQLTGQRITDELLLTVASCCCATLRKLELTGCGPSLTNNALKLLGSCQVLSALRVDSCKSFTQPGLIAGLSALSSLDDLALARLSSVGDSTLRAIVRKKIHVSRSLSLTEIWKTTGKGFDYFRAAKGRNWQKVCLLSCNGVSDSALASLGSVIYAVERNIQVSNCTNLSGAFLYSSSQPGGRLCWNNAADLHGKRFWQSLVK